jgi:hypothetical protein
MAATAPQLPGDSMIAYRASYVIQTYARAVEPVNFTPFSLACLEKHYRDRHCRGRISLPPTAIQTRRRR